MTRFYTVLHVLHQSKLESKTDEPARPEVECKSNRVIGEHLINNLRFVWILSIEFIADLIKQKSTACYTMTAAWSNCLFWWMCSCIPLFGHLEDDVGSC